MTEADKLFSELFMWINARSAILNSFLRLTQLGLPHAKPDVLAESKAAATWIATDHKTFMEPFLDAIGGINGLAKRLLDNDIDNYETAVRSAAIVFLHSIVDNATLEFLRVTALAEPKDWESFVSSKQIKLIECGSTPYQELLKDAIQKELDDLDRQSLLKKVDRLFQICKPPSGFGSQESYTFDRNRIETLDTLRHDIVHGYGPIPSLPDPEEEVSYATETCMFFVGMVNNRYNVKLWPPNMTRSLAKNDDTQINAQQEHLADREGAATDV